METLKLIKFKNAFDRFNKKEEIIDFSGENLLELRQQHFPAEIDVVIYINGRLIPQEEWALIIPRKNDFISILPSVQDKVVRVIAGVILIVVGVLASPAWGGSPYLIGAGISLTLGGVAELLFPIKKPQIPTTTGNDYDSSQTFGWNPSTVQQQGLVIPRAYGINKLYGNIIASNIEDIDDNQYLNVLLSLGAGVWKRLYDFKLNGQPVDNLRGVEIHTRLGKLNQDVIPNFNDTIIQNYTNQYVVKGTPVIYTTPDDDFDGLNVEITFPNGLWYANDQGELSANSVDYKIEIKKQGDTNWTTITRQVISVRTAAKGRWSLGFWESNEFDVFWYECKAGDNNPYSHYEGEHEYCQCSNNSYWHWLPNSDYYFFVDQTVDYCTATGSKNKPIRKTHKITNLPHGKYDIRVTNLTAPKESVRYGDACVLSAVQEIYQDDFQYPTEVLVGIKALATEQLSGGFRFSCLAECQYVRVYNGSSWTVEASNNPAWVAYDIATNPLFDDDMNVIEYRGYQPEQIDLDKFLEWANFCDELVPDGKGGMEKRVTFNGVFDRGMTTWQALIDVCKIGRAAPLWNGNKLTLFIDKAVNIRTQIFTDGNIEKNSFEEVFLPKLERTSEIESDFLNAEKDYERDTATIINSEVEGVKTNNQCFGLTKPSEVWRDGQYRLAYAQYLTRAIKFSADADAVVSTIGDKVGIQTNICKWGIEGGRIISATANSVTIDKEVEIEADKTYVILIRLSDDTLVEKTITNTPGIYSTLNISVPFTVIPQKYDIYSFGINESVVKDFKIVGIQGSKDLKFKITAIEYNPSIYGTDYNIPALPPANLSKFNMLPLVTSTKLEERLYISGSGVVRTKLVCYFKKPSSATYRYCEIWYKTNTNWVYAGISLTDSFEILDVREGMSYTVCFVTVNAVGNKTPINSSPQESIYIWGKTAKPSDVSEFWAQASIGGLRLDWSAVPDIDLDYYQIRWTANTTMGIWENAIIVAERIYVTTCTIPAAKDGMYLIKAVDTSGNWSENAATVITNIPSILNWNVIETLTQHPEFAGTKTNMHVDDNLLRLNGTGIFDSNEMFDSDENFDYGGMIAQIGYYETAPINFGSVQSVRCSYTVEFYGDNINAWFDSNEMFDSNEIFDRIADRVGVVAQIALSDNGVNFGDWQNFFVGDYTAKAVKFRVKAYTESQEQYITISSLTFIVDVPDRTESAEGVDCPAEGLNITYSRPFMALPRLACTIRNAQPGDTPVWTNQTLSGCNLKIMNNQQGVQRIVDWEAKRY